MSLATTLRLAKTPVPTGPQAIDRAVTQRQALHPISSASLQQPVRALEAILLIVNQDVAGPNDPMVGRLLAALWLHGRPYQDWADQQTTVHIVVRAYAQDQRVGRALGQQMFRRLLGEQFDQKRMTSATFEDGYGGAGVIMAHWRPESHVAAITAHGQSNYRMERPVRLCSASSAGGTTSMSHWSWWADRAL